MTRREADDEEDDGVKVHDIKFDEFGIMEDAADESTTAQLAKMSGGGAAAAAAAPTQQQNGDAAAVIDEDLFNDEDLDELEEDLENLDV